MQMSVLSTSFLPVNDSNQIKVSGVITFVKLRKYIQEFGECVFNFLFVFKKISL